MPPLSSVRSAQEALLNRTRDLGLGSCAWEAWAFYPRSAKSSTAPTDLRAVPALLLRGRRPAAYTNVLDPLGPVKAYTNVLDPLGPVKARLGLNSPPAPRNTQPRGVRSERTGWLPACAAGAWLRRHPSRGRCPGQRHRAGGGLGPVARWVLLLGGGAEAVRSAPEPPQPGEGLLRGAAAWGGSTASTHAHAGALVTLTSLVSARVETSAFGPRDGACADGMHAHLPRARAPRLRLGRERACPACMTFPCACCLAPA